MRLRDRMPVSWLLLRGDGGLDWTRRCLAVVCAATFSLCVTAFDAVRGVTPRSGPYSDDLLQNAGFRPGLLVALAFLTLPLGFLMAQVCHVGSERRLVRDERLRLAGAPRSLVVRSQLVEAVIIGVVGYALGRLVEQLVRATLGATKPGTYRTEDVLFDDGGTRIVQTTTHHGQVLRLPTDVVLGFATRAAGFVILLVVVLGWTWLGTRRTHRGRSSRLRPMARLLPMVAVAAFSYFSLAHPADAGGRSALVAIAAFILVLTACLVWLYVIGSQYVAAACGRVARLAGRPIVLLALRRIQRDASRTARATYSAVAVLTMVGFAQGTTTYVVSVSTPTSTGSVQALALVRGVVDVTVAVAVAMLLVAVLESLPRQRRDWAFHRAQGIPPGAARKALVIEAGLPILALGPLGFTVGALAARAFFGASTVVVDPVSGARSVDTVPVPLAALATTSAVALGAAVLLASVSGLAVGGRLSSSDVRDGW